MVAKPIITAEKAADLVKEGDVVMVGGFLGCGSAEKVLDALAAKGTKNLTLVCNDTAFHNMKTGLINFVAKLVAKKQFKKMIVTHIGTNAETQRQMNAGETDVVLVPQGTLAEQIRAGGAGLGGILTPTGVGTEVQKGKKVVELNGKKFLLEEALTGDVAIIKAHKADKAGNLVYAKSERNFNPLMAMACKTVIAEVDEIVEIGAIDPEVVITPSVFVHYLVKSGK
jgi:acetate CoA/acetoacetate CoA-transferase alpha subunit